MPRLLLASLVALSTVAGGGGQATQARITSGSSPDRSATRLRALPECDGSSSAVVHLSWHPASKRGRAQKVAVTQFADGFETDRFSVSPRLEPDAERFDWRDTNANGSYRWRVLTKHRSWKGSKISSFIGPSCGVEDYG